MSNDGHNLYALAKAAGLEMDSHESDLYLRETPEALALVKAGGWYFERFRHQETGAAWLDIPFAFWPWWQVRTEATS